MTRLRRMIPELRRIILSFGAIALISPSAYPAVSTLAVGEWKHRQAFTVEAGLNKIALPTETFALARPGFADLRVVGPDDHEIPYLLDVPEIPIATTAAPESFHVRLRRSVTEITVRTGTQAPLESIKLISGARDFLKPAQVETSSDGENWSPLAEGEPLVRQHGGDHAVLALRNVQAEWLRITLDDERTAAVAFSGAEVTLAPVTTAPSVDVPIDITRREEFLGETVLTLKLAAPELPLVQVAIEASDPLFSRQVTLTERQLSQQESVERTLAAGFISRSIAGAENVALHPAGFPVARELELHIANGSSSPLAIEHVNGRRKNVWLIFRAPVSGSYALLTGHAQTSAPAYDLAALASTLRATPETRTIVAAARDNPGFQGADPLKGAPLLAAAIDPRGWMFRKPVILAGPGVQELELDFEILAHARADLGDLRLVRDGRQIPYLLERTSLLRPFEIPLQPADDPRQPRLSRWKLPLPVDSLPVRRITIETSSPLFSRSFRLFELITDERGAIGQHALSPGIMWNRSSPQQVAELQLELTSEPATGTLFLETDNGDNLPITLSRARGACVVARLLFPSELAPADLYYGADSIPAPRYDLDLIASRIVREERKTARLGAEEGPDGRGNRNSASAGIRGGALLWVALGLVVVVLLFVIARLLPKPPAEKR